MNTQSEESHDFSEDEVPVDGQATNPMEEPSVTKARYRANAQVRLLGILADAVIASIRSGPESDSVHDT